MESLYDSEEQFLDGLDNLKARAAGLGRATSKSSRTDDELKARLTQQAAVAQLGQHALAGVSQPDLMDEAVHIVTRTLSLEFCSILELERGGEALLMAAGAGWERGAVGQYRLSLDEPGSPARALLSGEPLTLMTSPTGAKLKELALLRAHRIESGLSIIIPGSDIPYGVLSAFSRKRRQFSGEDLHFLQTVANVLAAAIARKRSEDELAQVRNALASQLLDMTRLQEISNRALAESELLNTITTAASGENSLAGILSSTLDRLSQVINFTGGSIALVEGDYLEIRAAAGPFAALALGTRLPRSKGRSWQVIDSGKPFFSNDLEAAGVKSNNPLRSYLAVPLIWRGRVFGLLEVDSVEKEAFTQADLALMQKVAATLSGPIELAQRYNSEVKALSEARLAQQRLAFLATASTELASSLDYEVTLERLVELTVPQHADWCAVDILEEDGNLRRLAVAHSDPARNHLVSEEKALFPLEREPRHPIRVVLETAESQFSQEVNPELLETIAPNSGHRALLQALGFRSFAVIPLLARGRVLGVITFAMGESGRRYEPDDLSLFEDLARRAAIAVDNALLYRKAQEYIEAQKELDALKDQFLSVASHELRTPLTSIKGYAQILQRNRQRNEDEAPQQSRETRMLDNITRQVDRMEKLISEMLEMSRLQTGKLELRYREINLVELVRRVVEQQRDVSPDHRLILTAEASIITGWVDDIRLEQVLCNLLSNAIKYSPPGTTVETGIRENLVGGNGPEALVWVSDQGPGIKPEHQARIFDRFYRARTQEITNVDGLGLGLFISQQIVTQHGGRMWLASTPGEGSTFYFALPLRPPQEKEEQE